MFIEAMARDTGIPAEYLEALALSAAYRYKVYRVPKRRGGKRQIEQPSRALKVLQRWIVKRVMQDVPVHDASAAYRVGSNVRLHADKHAENNYLLRLDIKEFFTSIKASDVRRHLEDSLAHLHYVEGSKDIDLVVSALTRRGGLVIGAPSSPMLANQVMFRFDQLVSRWCGEKGITYTRYADDLYFSTRTPGLLWAAHQRVADILHEMKSPKLRLNKEKTANSSRKRKRLVTGLSLTTDGKVSLGREKKREIRSLVHKSGASTLSVEKKQYLAGYLAYARSVEPEFVERLERKYGQDLVDAARRTPDPSILLRPR